MRRVEYMANLYIQAPNILSSMYGQKKLSDVFGFEILGGKESHFTDRFVVVSPPEQYKEDKPLILYFEPTMSPDGVMAPENNHKWIPLIDALQLIALVHPKIIKSNKE